MSEGNRDMLSVCHKIWFLPFFLKRFLSNYLFFATTSDISPFPSKDLFQRIFLCPNCLLFSLFLMWTNPKSSWFISKYEMSNLPMLQSIVTIHFPKMTIKFNNLLRHLVPFWRTKEEKYIYTTRGEAEWLNSFKRAPRNSFSFSQIHNSFGGLKRNEVQCIVHW